MQRKNINDGWQFMKLPDESFCYDRDNLDGLELDWRQAQELVLPHTWFEEGEAYQGLAAYRKKLEPQKGTEKVYLEFEGVEQRCLVFVNGKVAGRHQGAYATFRVEVPEEAYTKDMEVLVLADNTKTEGLAPMFGDFTVFGGIYRNVNLLLAGKASFDYLYYGTGGVIVRSHMTEGRGEIEIEPHVTADVPKEAVIRYTLYSPEGQTLVSEMANARMKTQLMVAEPILWNGKGRGNCYRLRAELLCGREELDLASVSIGFREILLDPDRGLLLNGEPYKIKGVAKHQDYAGVYNAVSREHMEKDFNLIDEIGANAVRLSHYQHPQYAYQICDERGYLVWAEIPMLKLTRKEALFETSCEQLKELILQNIHHPSIYCWGIQNEIAMFRDDAFMHERCLAWSDLVHEYDPDRPSAGANLFSVKQKSKMNEVSDLVGYNLYFGWYYGQIQDYDDYLDRFHAVKPHVSFWEDLSRT